MKRMNAFTVAHMLINAEQEAFSLSSSSHGRVAEAMIDRARDVLTCCGESARITKVPARPLKPRHRLLHYAELKNNVSLIVTRA